jgi:hypothetical protein
MPDAYLAQLTLAERKAYRRGMLDAASEVAGHWNDRSTMTNQYQQAQRSANVLIRLACKVDIETTDIPHV